MAYSFLLSVYARESHHFLQQSLDSLMRQSLPADEVVLVEDGPLGEDLHLVIEEYRQVLNIKSVVLPNNVGLGAALQAGLQACSNEIVGRMDTDDVAHPDRAKLQYQFLMDHPEIDAVGSSIDEFELDPSQPYARRVLPETHEELLRFAKTRNPLNHMTVFFRKSKVLAAGGYQPCTSFEDYYLWMRMVAKGSKLANIETSLVYARAGAQMMKRRGGFKYLSYEWNFQKKQLELGLINIPEFVFFFLAKSAVRIMPSSLRLLMYKLCLR